MNLVRYQNAYNLSAKVITVMDEVYDKLINYMGV
jgi:flagellar hook-associated protein 1 FlgK